jgi:hypothetical protein
LPPARRWSRPPLKNSLVDSLSKKSASSTVILSLAVKCRCNKNRTLSKP